MNAVCLVESCTQNLRRHNITLAKHRTNSLSLSSTMTDTLSVTSLYTTETSVVVPRSPPIKKDKKDKKGKKGQKDKKGDLLAVLATKKRPFRRHFQQPDDPCHPPVMPKRSTQQASSIRSILKSERTDDSSVEPPLARRKARRDDESPRRQSLHQPHKDTRQDAPPGKPNRLRHYQTKSAAAFSQPRVDRYKSLMSKPSLQKSAFRPLTTYYGTTKPVTRPTADPATTPRCSNATSRKRIVQTTDPAPTKPTPQLSPASSTEETNSDSHDTPRCSNTSRQALTPSPLPSLLASLPPPPPPHLPDWTDASCSNSTLSTHDTDHLFVMQHSLMN